MRRRIASVAVVAAATVPAAAALGLSAGDRSAGAASPALPPVTITGVAVDHSSVKIDFLPVPGAKDYRVFDVAAPTKVKYAGLVHLFVPSWAFGGGGGNGLRLVVQPDGVTPAWPPQIQLNRPGEQPASISVDIPAPEVEWNSAGDHKPHTLVVQAVDRLGPYPPDDLGTIVSDSLVPANGMQGMGMLGSNAGPTPDGLVSTNGQGPSSNDPQPIAQSAPFTVQTDPSIVPVPSRAGASQVFLDTFDNSEAGSIRQVSQKGRVTTYSLNAGTPISSTITEYTPTPRNGPSVAVPFIMGDHFMDLLPDGGTGSGSGSWMMLTPDQQADFSAGRLLHLTMEVDQHGFAHRWVSFDLTPAGSSAVPPFVDGKPALTSLLAPGQYGFGEKSFLIEQAPPSYQPASVLSGARNGSAFEQDSQPADDRQRLDLFLDTRHAALFVDGALAGEADFPAPFPFTQARVSFGHTFYGAEQARSQLLAQEPWEANFLVNDTFVDERHWDNMGFEVLPAGTQPGSGSWASLGTLIRTSTLGTLEGPAFLHPPVLQPGGAPKPPSGGTGTVTGPGIPVHQ